MSKEQIKEIAKDICQSDYCNTECHSRCRHGENSFCWDVEILAEKLYNAGYRKQSEWISVDERLPEETEEELEVLQGKDKTKLTTKISEMVLVYSNYPERPYITIDRTIDGTWSNNWYITHWMPLPKAPKMEGG